MAEDAKKTEGDSKEAKEAQKAKGLYNVTFLKDSGNYEKGEKSKMHYSTAKALAAHKVVEIGAKVTRVEKLGK